MQSQSSITIDYRHSYLLIDAAGLINMKFMYVGPGVYNNLLMSFVLKGKKGYGKKLYQSNIEGIRIFKTKEKYTTSDALKHAFLSVLGNRLKIIDDNLCTFYLLVGAHLFMIFYLTINNIKKPILLGWLIFYMQHFIMLNLFGAFSILWLIKFICIILLIETEKHMTFPLHYYN
ncbi:hypothetical protein ACJX0J_040092 [Zea mays]